MKATLISDNRDAQQVAFRAFLQRIVWIDVVLCTVGWNHERGNAARFQRIHFQGIHDDSDQLL